MWYSREAAFCITSWFGAVHADMEMELDPKQLEEYTVCILLQDLCRLTSTKVAPGKLKFNKRASAGVS